MDKVADEAYAFNGTRYHLRAFIDPFRIEKPVFVVEEAVKNKVSLVENRVEIAKDLAKTLGRGPDEITWLEMAPDGSLKKVDFEYTHTDTIYPNAASLTPEERQAVKDGEINSDKVTRYNTHESPVPREEYQARVGDALDSYEKRQNHAFHRMEAQTDKAAYRQEREAELARNPLYDYAPDL